MDDSLNTDSSVVRGPWSMPSVESKRMSDKDKAHKQRLVDGQAVLDALHQRYAGGRKLTHDEAAVLARNLYEALPQDKEKRAAVDRKFGELYGWDFILAQKERHSLTLAPHQKAVANDGDAGKGCKRLRTDPERYRRLIEAIATVQTPKGSSVESNTQLLADRVAFGTGLHPVDPGTASRVENLYRRLQDVADAVEQRLGLLRQFRELADYKINGLRDGGSDNWPLGICDTKKSQDWLQRENAYWGPAYEGDLGEGSTNMYCESWFDLLCWLPHFPLGFDADFDMDVDYWPLPESWWQDIGHEYFDGLCYKNEYSDASDDEVWRKRFEMRLKLFDALGSDDLVPLRWVDGDGGVQLHMGEQGGVDKITARLVQYRRDWLRWAGRDEDEDDDIPNMFWLMLYPSRGLDRLIPVLGLRWCHSLEIEALTPIVIANEKRSTMRRVRNDDGSVDIVTESIVERLQRALEIMSLHTTGELDSALCRGLLETGTFLQRQPHMREIERMREQHRLHERLMHEISRGAWPRTK